MSFEESLRVGLDRIGVLVGRGGAVKTKIEELCAVRLRIDSRSGEVQLTTSDTARSSPFIAAQIVKAIGRGFSPERAFKLADGEKGLLVIDLREFSGKSSAAIRRIKGRLIGLDGRSRRLIEELTGSYVSVYGHTVAVLGTAEQTKLAKEAVVMLASGSQHKAVYTRLQRERTKRKVERMQLWEGLQR